MKKKQHNQEEVIANSRPSVTVEGREDQMIALAINCAEKQLREGTASSQVITHYLKLGTTIAKLEQTKLENEIELLKAKAKAYSDVEEIKAMYSDALKAMQTYSGQGGDNIDD